MIFFTNLKKDVLTDHDLMIYNRFYLRLPSNEFKELLKHKLVSSY